MPAATVTAIHSGNLMSLSFSTGIACSLAKQWTEQKLLTAWGGRLRLAAVLSSKDEGSVRLTFAPSAKSLGGFRQRRGQSWRDLALEYPENPSALKPTSNPIQVEGSEIASRG
jgi:hypothetical protein